MRGFLRHQGLSSCGLRRGDLHHVACWIRSSSLGDVHWHCWKDFYPGRLDVKDRAKLKDHRRDPYHEDNLVSPMNSPRLTPDANATALNSLDIHDYTHLRT
jgi:hypothetical protein